MYFTFLSLLLLVAKCLSVPHPWVAESRPDSWWTTRHQALLDTTMAHKADIKVVFLGDSITEGWGGNGRDVWNQHYANRHAYNYGIGGDRTEHLLYRMQHGEFDGINPKFIVLKIGTNNMYFNEEDIAHGIKEVLSQIFIKIPATRVLLLGIIPRAGDLEKKVESVNTMISKYNDDKKVFYLDMSPHFQDTPGKEKAGLYVDTVHLTKQGYQVWYETMEPLFSKLYDM